MAYDHPTPTDFVLDEEQRKLMLFWSDGHEGIDDWEKLRWACPCAGCAGEAGLPGALQSRQSLSPEETSLVNVQPEGRFGLRLVWQGGHRAGIYTYEKLRVLCECEQCREKRLS
jgi:DUF971 family protein